jgi:hypothetical protein
MYYVLSVKICDTREDFLHHHCGLKISELLPLMDLVVELTALAHPTYHYQILNYSKTI